MQLMIKTLTGRKQSFNFDEDNTVSLLFDIHSHFYLDSPSETGPTGKRRNHD